MHFPKLSLTIAAALAVSSCGFKHKKYENPITAQTQQPDKVLFDKAIKDIEKGRYEIARITLNTLINTGFVPSWKGDQTTEQTLSQLQPQIDAILAKPQEGFV